MIERIPFGATGHMSSRTIFGAAALGAMTQDRADATLAKLDLYGVNHIDVAASYGDAELRLAPFLNTRREDFFLATKTGLRTADAAREQLHASLERMQVDQIDLIHGNIATMDQEIPPAEVVTLDKVICCYDDMPGLVQASLVKSRKLHGLIYPRDNWLVRAVFGFDNLISRLQGSDFRTFVYPTKEVDGLIRGNGFQMLSRRNSAGWQVVVYGRVGA